MSIADGDSWNSTACAKAGPAQSEPIHFASFATTGEHASQSEESLDTDVETRSAGVAEGVGVEKQTV